MRLKIALMTILLVLLSVGLALSQGPAATRSNASATRGITSSGPPSEKAGCSMSDLEHARLLIRIAARDLKALRGMLDPKTFDDEVFSKSAKRNKL